MAEAKATPFLGWDFSSLGERSSVRGVPWDYRAEVLARAPAKRLLDMGTGGGEMLARMRPPAQFTVATEAWAPNVPVAAVRLGDLGTPVVRDEGSPDNLHGIPERGRLPFRDDAFGLVINRHEAFNAHEVARVLRRGGAFVTQQVDLHSYDDFLQALDLEISAESESWLPVAAAQMEVAGLRVDTARHGEELSTFYDVGALAWYLRSVPWAVEGFDVDRHAPQLRRIHEAGAPFTARQRRFLLDHHRPGMTT